MTNNNFVAAGWSQNVNRSLWIGDMVNIDVKHLGNVGAHYVLSPPLEVYVLCGQDEQGYTAIASASCIQLVKRCFHFQWLVEGLYPTLPLSSRLDLLICEEGGPVNIKSIWNQYEINMKSIWNQYEINMK